MLQSTFLHLPGIGPKKERQYWRQGITTLDALEKKLPQQLGLFNELNTNPIESYRAAIKNGEIDYIAKLLTPRDYYRVALTYPNEVLFLDIETTGLSLYYDRITIIGWSSGKTYGLYKAGEKPDLLLEALSKAKVLVTFNGTMFDLKFISQTFPNAVFPPIHIDLRYFARRVGLSGGQKAIEIEIGFKREDALKEIQGESAPVLWHEWRRGNLKALKKLIQYNHADVEGMKAILDCSISLFCESEGIPESIRPNVVFSKKQSKIKFSSSNSSGIKITKYSGSTKPLVTYSSLNKIKSIEDLVTIGIDLVSSEDRETGYCILKGNEAKTFRIKTDKEMIDLAIDNNADLVSIDSPLSIPFGRTSFFDDDPMRDQFGITRECERVLAKRGIRSYPCLIQSMQKLTKRGMELATKFRKIGIPVIESYPGAAQDIMQIPRKQSGLEYLTKGLEEFGICGDFLTNPVSHDELDAITSALVALFFWTGKFEALGNPDESYLFIPDIDIDPSIWLNRKVFGLCGHIASGKTTAANYLKEHGFKVSRYSMVLEDMLKEDGQEINRASLQQLGAQINQDKGQRWLGAQVLSKVMDSNRVAIDGIRFREDKAFLVEAFGPSFKLLFIDAPEQIRTQRMRSLRLENVSPKEAAKSLTESEIFLLEELSDVTVLNVSSIREFHKTLNKIAIGSE